MKKILLLLLFIANFCSAQENPVNEGPLGIGKEDKKKDDIRNKLTYLISRNGTDKYALINGPQNYAYFFSITLSFDDSGKVDAVYFSKNRPQNLDSFLGSNISLQEKIKGLDLTYKQYASKLVLIPFFYYRLGDNTLDYKSGFLKSIEGLLPEVGYQMSKKSWVVLDTMTNTFGAIE